MRYTINNRLLLLLIIILCESEIFIELKYFIVNQAEQENRTTPIF